MEPSDDEATGELVGHFDSLEFGSFQADLFELDSNGPDAPEHVQDVVLLQVSRLIGKTEKCSEKFALVAIIDVRERIAHLTTTLDLVYKVELEVWVMSL